MDENLLEVKNLKKYFKVKGGKMLHAVNDISLAVKEGETLGLVGESGCGKSTVGKIIAGLSNPTDGEITFRGKDVLRIRGVEKRRLRREIQIVFQDPYSSLNARKTVKQILSEPFRINHVASGAAVEEKVQELLKLTGLQEDILYKYPHELDGGKRQTIGIARALALRPTFIVCDEPVSALDVSIQAQIINLMMDLQEELKLTYLFISHDLSVVRHLSKRIAVMYLGKIVELADTEELFSNPLHPYTQALLSAVPTIKVGQKKGRIILNGDVPSPIDLKPGCYFCSRCWKAKEQCAGHIPQLLDVGNGHMVSCYLQEST